MLEVMSIFKPVAIPTRKSNRRAMPDGGGTMPKIAAPAKVVEPIKAELMTTFAHFPLLLFSRSSDHHLPVFSKAFDIFPEDSNSACWRSSLLCKYITRATAC